MYEVSYISRKLIIYKYVNCRLYMTIWLTTQFQSGFITENWTKLYLHKGNQTYSGLFGLSVAKLRFINLHIWFVWVQIWSDQCFRKGKTDALTNLCWIYFVLAEIKPNIILGFYFLEYSVAFLHNSCYDFPITLHVWI